MVRPVPEQADVHGVQEFVRGGHGRVALVMDARVGQKYGADVKALKQPGHVAREAAEVRRAHAHAQAGELPAQARYPLLDVREDSHGHGVYAPPPAANAARRSRSRCTRKKAKSPARTCGRPSSLSSNPR